MDVGTDHAILDLERGGAAHPHVFTDGGHHLGHVFGDRMLRAGELGGFELFRIAIGGKRQLGDIGYHGLELFVAGDEVGFGIHFDGGTGGAVHSNADEAFGGNAR